MKTLLLGTNIALLLLLFGTNTWAATNFSTVIGVPLKRQVIADTTTAQSLRIDFANVQGYSTQINVLDCTACNITIRFFSSVDGETFTEVEGLTTVLDTNPGTTIFNSINAFFKWLRIDVTNDDVVESITVEVLTSIKVGL